MRTDAFFAFVRERESVRLRKEAGAPFPWTTDEILSTYKFTNVRREHDRTTKRFFDHYADHRSDEYPSVQFLNCAIARYFGDADFVTSLGWVDAKNVSITETILDHVHSYRTGRLGNVFTGAYVISNFGRREPKEEIVCEILEDLWQHLTQRNLLDLCRDGIWRVVVGYMSGIYGFSGTGFMAKEVTLDTMFFPSIWGGLERPHDYWSWTPIGPGALRGAERVCMGDLCPEQGKFQSDSAFETIMCLYEAQKDHWPSEWGRLSPHDIQFQLCEFDKMERVRLGQGRPRSKYRPSGR